MKETSRGIPTGFDRLDRFLPEGGWPLGALTEILASDEGIGELRLVLPALAEVTSRGRWVALISPPHVPYAPALSAAGVELSRVMVVRAESTPEVFRVAEEVLRSAVGSMALMWPVSGKGPVNPSPNPRTEGHRHLRRVQLAAEQGGGCGFLWRPVAAAGESSPAALRLRLRPSISPSALEAEVIKCRGAPSHRVIRLPIDRRSMGPPA